MIPASDEYLSVLMGAAAISDGELTQLGIRIVQGAGSAFRGLLGPVAAPRLVFASGSNALAAGSSSELAPVSRHGGGSDGDPPAPSQGGAGVAAPRANSGLSQVQHLVFGQNVSTGSFSPRQT